MPDGTRHRRFSTNSAKRQWYARHRAVRFNRRFGLETSRPSVRRQLLIAAGRHLTILSICRSKKRLHFRDTADSI